MSEAENLFTDGAAYERLMGRWSRLAGKAFIEWLALPEDLRWLDVGCGNGAFTEELVSRCAPASVNAIDPSEEQLAHARARPGTVGVDYQVGSAQDLPFAAGSFDIAVMALVIAFVPDAARAVSELARVVRPGGTVATYMWDFEHGGAPVSPIVSAMQDLEMPLTLPPNRAASGMEPLRGFWQLAGLESIELRQIAIPVSFASFDDFWESNTLPIGPQGKALTTASDSDKARLRARLRERVPVAADGRVAFESVANAIKGRVPG